jgi:hypothetical protein
MNDVWMNRWKADNDPVSDTLYAIVDQKAARETGKIMYPTITYIPLHLARKGACVQETYPTALGWGEKRVCDKVRHSLNIQNRKEV